MSLTYQDLRAAVAGTVVGIRACTPLEPLGGAGDKVFPPTYATADSAATKYATEQRKQPDGSTVTAVVLDSVASQANRMEQALLRAVRDGVVAMPLTSVDFRGVEGLQDVDRITDLDAPHRIFDAILRDSHLGEVGFRLSPVGRSVTEASVRNAAPLLAHSPMTLVLGGWDSTGPRGGLGAKYERAVTAEIVALDVETGSKTASRLDPLGIERDALTVYRAADGIGWTLEPSEALIDKGNPKAIRPSETNHGNIAPSIETRAGGVTAARIEARYVLSLIQLRRLRFPLDEHGAPVADQPAAEVAARTVLAALALCAATLSVEEGYDLRSRCVLVPTEPMRFTLVGRDGTRTDVDLTSTGAIELLSEAVGEAARVGLPWDTDELLLTPTPRLVTLVAESRRSSAASAGDAG